MENGCMGSIPGAWDPSDRWLRYLGHMLCSCFEARKSWGENLADLESVPYMYNMYIHIYIYVYIYINYINM